ncbi:MAG TPA: ion transporter [Thermoleophilaceae bacterium]|jgi:voltage-gated sodium channel
MRGSFAQTAGRIVESDAFTYFIAGVILLNAAVLGLETYDRIDREAGGTLELANDVFLGIFVLELLLRFASYGSRPQDFFRSGWNVFDLVVVGAAFVPGLSKNSTLLRLARLARVVRVVRLLPDVRVLMLAMARSIPPMLSLAVLAGLVLYVYAMVGWMLFGDEDPERWGDIGQALLTMFVLLTLENFPDVLEDGMAIEPWSWIFFVSFALLAAFILLNVLIGVVINSMDEAREIELANEREALKKLRAEPGAEEPLADTALEERVVALKVALEELEREMQLAERDPRRSRGRR